jgi:hypothetical protein
MIDLLRQIRTLPKHTIVFCHTFTKDSAGQTFPEPDGVDLIYRPRMFRFKV